MQTVPFPHLTTHCTTCYIKGDMLKTYLYIPEQLQKRNYSLLPKLKIRVRQRLYKTYPDRIESRNDKIRNNSLPAPRNSKICEDSIGFLVQPMVA